MDDRIVENTATTVPDIPEDLEKVLLFAIDEGHKLLEQGQEITPFTALVVKDNVFIEKHPGANPEACFNEARHTVEGVLGATSYAFCYDGYIHTDKGMIDAIIAEGGLPGEPQGCAVGLIYHKGDDGTYRFESDIAYIGEAPNFMMYLGAKQDAAAAAANTDEASDADDAAGADAAQEVAPYDISDANARDFPTIAEQETSQSESENDA